MNFQKYVSLSKEKDLDFTLNNFIIPMINKGKTPLFVIQEKIHGANFSFNVGIKDGKVDEIKICSRNNFLKVGDNFKGASTIRENYLEKINELSNDILTMIDLKNNDQVKNIVFYGEDAGPGIQHGVNYGDEIDFYGFDIKVVFNGGEKDYNKWFTYEKMFQLYKSKNIPIAPTLAIGSYEEIAKLSCTFNSHIDEKSLKQNDDEVAYHIDRLRGLHTVVDPYVFSYYGDALKSFEEKPHNLAEGYVMRLFSFDFNDDDLFDKELSNYFSGREIERFIFKIKTEKFSERKQRTNKPPRSTSIKDELVKSVVDEFCEYINEQRAIAVLSKEPNVSSKNFGNYLKLILQDAYEDVNMSEDKLDVLNNIIDRNFEKTNDDMKNAHSKIYNETQASLRSVFAKGIY